MSDDTQKVEEFVRERMEDLGVKEATETDELWQALAEMQLAFNKQAVMLRVAFNILQSMGFTETLLNKIYQLEAVKMLGATGPEDAMEVLGGRKQEIEYLIGELLTEDKMKELMGLFNVEKRVAQAQEEAAKHPENSVIFSAGN